MRQNRIVYICDWLPPDYGAVGQYSLLFARQMAAKGQEVVLGGLSSYGNEVTEESVGEGHLKIVKIHAKLYDKAKFARRLGWTFRTNTRLIYSLWSHLRTADEILFTGSPPLLLHWIAPLNMLLKKRLVYRITDFHPECLMASRKAVPWLLDLLYRLTVFWRKRVNAFEVLGTDQAERLIEIGIPSDRITLKRDPSPVEINTSTKPLARPLSNTETLLLLYSGNWGVAHDYETFVEGYRRHHESGSGRLVLWLNAVGSAVNEVQAALRKHDLPFISGRPVPLEQLASLLITPDAHLITLSDAFVGFVLPSKVHGCIQSGKPTLFIGSKHSDVHALCVDKASAAYKRVDVGDLAGCTYALERLADSIMTTRRRTDPQLGLQA